jgi:hypothetical protein
MTLTFGDPAQCRCSSDHRFLPEWTTKDDSLRRAFSDRHLRQVAYRAPNKVRGRYHSGRREPEDARGGLAQESARKHPVAPSIGMLVYTELRLSLAFTAVFRKRNIFDCGPVLSLLRLLYLTNATYVTLARFPIQLNRKAL